MNRSGRQRWATRGADSMSAAAAIGPASGALGRLRLLERLHHLGGMSVSLDLRPHMRDPPLRVDEEARALDAHRRLAVVGLERPGAVARRDVMVDVRQERERQAVLGLEMLVTRGV